MALRGALRVCLAKAGSNGLENVLGLAFVRSLAQAPADGPPELAVASLGPILDRPFADVLAVALERCASSGVLSRPALPDNADLVDLLVEQEEELQAWQACISDGLRGSLCAEGSADLEERLSLILSRLGCRGICMALGQRRTIGTCDSMLPPSRQELINAFNTVLSLGSAEGGESSDEAEAGVAQLDAQAEVLRAQIKTLSAAGSKDSAALMEVLAKMKEITKQKREYLQPGATLSVGARAFMKHAHRGSEGFWNRATEGTFAGGDESKNKVAEELICRVLNEAVWGNLHGLPGGLLTFEVRVGQGYGARWTTDAGGELRFRGLLEPQMKDGHEKRWRHDISTA